MNNETATGTLILLKEMKKDIKYECYTSIERCEYGLSLKWKCYFPQDFNKPPMTFQVRLNQDELKESQVNLIDGAIQKATRYINNA